MNRGQMTEMDEVEKEERELGKGKEGKGDRCINELLMNELQIILLVKRC